MLVFPAYTPKRRHIHPEAVSMTLFGKSVVGDVIK
jgi:hypothetical protein